jgi:hypothetical protein
MKSLNLFIVLLISITLIYLALINTQNSTYKIDYQENDVEHFGEDPKIKIAGVLGFDSSRLHNFKETGDPNRSNEYQITFDVHPRSINQIAEPTIDDLVKKFSKLKLNENPISIVNTANKTILLSKINFQQLENKKLAEIRALETKFENPEFEPAAKYLQSLQRGVQKDVWIEPRYKFENNKLVLEPLPTPTQKPSSTSTPTPTPPRR